MSISSANSTQLAEVNQYVVTMRSTVASLMQTMATMNALTNEWNQTVSGIIGTPSGLTVTDSSNLAGIVPLTDTDVTNLTSYFEGILTTYYDTTHQQIFIKACGPTNAV